MKFVKVTTLRNISVLLLSSAAEIGVEDVHSSWYNKALSILILIPDSLKKISEAEACQARQRAQGIMAIYGQDR